ncbi:carboxylate-amine ligase [Spinactinospora alkalitolerans]|uniref:Putative glutamate--cysteine ligase 2 n=1 Tax=Spinactinospora alkalitolerans TaxID=687207 RepID=A0A852TZQ1_9ACTN|nr:glutamate--cysteine ligase [Spinactinospora alkalitolerans]NYE49301.1 carboxylate-amine ligase [Spinactinospora alkalitolerans]
MTTAERLGHGYPTVGVEEEFLLVDADGHLSARGPEVLGDTQRGSGEVQCELARCQVESATSVCGNAGELLADLRSLRARLAASARHRGLRVLAVGAPVLAESRPPPVTPERRYRRMAEHFGAIVDSGGICGCHVHVAIPDRETGVRVSNHLRPWLPVLLALTANSPFSGGADTGYASWRQVTWSRWPSALPTPLFASLADYEARVRGLLDSGAALDRGMIYWDIRLSEHNPTLEVRVCDVAATAEEAALIAVLVRGLVSAGLGDVAAGRRPPDLPVEALVGQLWRAARGGLEGRCADPETGELTPARVLLKRLLERVRPDLAECGDLDFAESALAALYRMGDGARRQRMAFRRRESLTDVVNHIAATTCADLVEIA